MKTTKKPAACTIPRGRNPDKHKYEMLRQDYERLRKSIDCEPALASLLNRLVKQRGVRALGDVPPILPPHASVPYGHPCYRQCYQEMSLYMGLAQKAADFIAAIGPYNTANMNMSDCLGGIPT